MLTKAREKQIRSLQQKKFRSELGLFLVEGAKGVLEACASDLDIEEIFCTESFFTLNEDKLTKKCSKIVFVKESLLSKLGTFSSNNAAIAVIYIPKNEELVADNDFVILLDEIKDPGNLGTIIRTADWYGITKIICSNDSVDVFNPKVINATMGSFGRVKLFYTDFDEYLSKTQLPVFGAYLGGESIYSINYPSEGYLLMGNESKGINSNLEKYVSNKITIPRKGTAESLNVAIATSIICDNIMRPK